MGYHIQRAAVIGSGTMGGGIAALLAGVGVPTLILDIVPDKLTPAEEAAGLTLKDRAVRNRIVDAGWKVVGRQRPPSILSQDSTRLVTLGNLEDDFEKLAEVDWIIEVIVENLKIKRSLYERIETVRKENCIVSSNTSGIPIQDLAEGRSPGFRAHFLGTHFFNPPRWLKLLELIPLSDTQPDVLQVLRDFAENRLGKGVVICKDTPNFVANRFLSLSGAQGIAYALDHGYTLEEVDAITGELIGRPKTATFRLYDLIGIDVIDHVSRNLYDAIPQDESREILKHAGSQRMFGHMIDHKWLGNKTDVGFSKKVITESGAREFWVLNLKTLEHEAPGKARYGLVGKGRKIEDLGERLRWLTGQAEAADASEEDRRLAQYLWSITAFALAYASRRIPEIADDPLAVDQAIRWGFMHEMGPFEIWDALGVRQTTQRMKQEGLEVADWVQQMLAGGAESFYLREGEALTAVYRPGEGRHVPIPADARVATLRQTKTQPGAVLRQNTSASLIDMGDGVGLIEFHSKANSLDQDIFDMLAWGLDEAEAGLFQALVLGNEGQHFCAGANVFVLWMASQQGDFEQVDRLIRGMQSGLLRMRYFPKPIVAAPFGMTLGGGAELVMSCARRVAAAETFIGLVEVGVGLVPAGTGCKEMLRRVVNPVMRIPDADPISVVRKVFEQIALAKVATGAHEAVEFGFFERTDRIVMNRDHLLAQAKRTALAMAAEGYLPPPPETVYVAGRDVLAALRAAVWGMKEAGWASEHDARIAQALGWVLCGGDLTEPAWVPEQTVLDLEREAFLGLCHEPKTLERMAHLLQHNKPLRN